MQDSESLGVPSLEILTSTARVAVSQAQKLADARESIVCAEDLVIALLQVGPGEPRFKWLMQSAGLKTAVLALDLTNFRREEGDFASHSQTEILALSMNFWDRLADSHRAETSVDCVSLLSGLLTSDYLPEVFKKILAVKGLERRIFASPAELAEKAEREAAVAAKPPLGYFIAAADLPPVIDREAEVGEALNQYARGEAVLLYGPAGSGKSLIARTAAALSQIPSIWVSAAELNGLSTGMRAEIMRFLVSYLVDVKGGLVLTDLDLIPLADTGSAPWFFIPFNIPLLATVTSAEGLTAYRSPKDWIRVPVVPLSEEHVLPALVAWVQHPTHPFLSEENLAIALDLTRNFLAPQAGAKTPLLNLTLDLIRTAAQVPANPPAENSVTREPDNKNPSRALAVVTNIPVTKLSGGRAVEAKPGSLLDRIRKAESGLNKTRAEANLPQFTYTDSKPTGKSLFATALALGLNPHGRSSTQSEISEQQLKRAVCTLTNLPLAIVCEKERRRVASLETRLANQLIGQTAAVKTVAAAIKRRQLAFGPSTRPIGAFLFVGPTGVGKTELAKILAREIYGSEAALVRFDMAEFYDDHEIARLIGSPPGYLGSDKDGQLIKALKNQPRGVLLLDEIEKADHRLYDFFLGAFDYGVVTASNSGEAVSLRDWIIIMTSNIGSAEGQRARNGGTLGFSPQQTDAESRALSARSLAIKKHFELRPEFINRLDAIVEFKDLSYEEMNIILSLHFETYADLHRRAGLHLELGPRLREKMVRAALSSGLGARELVKRQFDTLIVDTFTETLLAGGYYNGAIYQFEVAADNQQILVNRLDKQTNN
jgi:MoxR-like ATPase